MSYAIIETGGKQLRVEPGRFYDIELLAVGPEESITIDKVLLVCHEGAVHVGQPYVEGAEVDGTVLSHFRGRKVLVYKMRPKKKTRKKRGHRQEQTRFMIDAIRLNGEMLAVREDIIDLDDDDSEAFALDLGVETLATTAVEALESEAIEAEASATEASAQEEVEAIEAETEATEAIEPEAEVVETETSEEITVEAEAVETAEAETSEEE